MAKYVVQMWLETEYEIDAENEDKALDKAFEHWEKAEPKFDVYVSEEQDNDMTEEKYYGTISDYQMR